MKTLLIIGGSGFLGGSFFDFFNKNNKSKFNIKKIIFLSRKGKKLGNKINKKIQFEYKKSDILNLKKLPICDYIIYAANSANNKTNIRALKKFSSLLNTKFLKTKIIFTSSGAVYGLRNKKKNIKENEKINFNSILKYKNYKKEYALTKLKMENIFKNLGFNGYQVSIARLFTFFGTRIEENQKYAISDLIYSANKFNKIIIKNKNAIRSYMSADDMVAWLIKILFYSNNYCPVFNVGSEIPYSIKDLSNIISKFKKIKIIYKNFNNEKDCYIPNTKKARLKFNLKCQNNIIKYLRKKIF